MNTKKQPPTIDPNLCMDEDEFDRAMGKALGTPPPTEPTGKLKSVPKQEPKKTKTVKGRMARS